MKQFYNVRDAIRAAHAAASLGAAVHVPHLSYHWHVMFPRPYEDWMADDFEVIARCDALYRMDGESPGADREVAFATEHAIPVLRDMESVGRFVHEYARRAKLPATTVVMEPTETVEETFARQKRHVSLDPLEAVEMFERLKR